MVFLPGFFTLSFPSPCIRASFWRLWDKAYRNAFKARGFEHASEGRSWEERGEEEIRFTLFCLLELLKSPVYFSCQATDVFHYLPGHDLRRNISFAFSPRLYFMIVIGIPQWINRWEKYLVVASRFIYTFSGCELSCATSTHFRARLRLYWKPTF